MAMKIKLFILLSLFLLFLDTSLATKGVSLESAEVLIAVPACNRLVNYTYYNQVEDCVDQITMINGSPVSNRVCHFDHIPYNISIIEPWDCDDDIDADVSINKINETDYEIIIDNIEIQDEVKDDPSTDVFINVDLPVKKKDKKTNDESTINSVVLKNKDDKKSVKFNMKKTDLVGNELHVGFTSAVYLINTTTQYNISNGLISVILDGENNGQIWGYNESNGYVKSGFFNWYLNSGHTMSGTKTVLLNTTTKIVIGVNNSGLAINVTLNSGERYVHLDNATIISSTNQLNFGDYNANVNNTNYINNWTTLQTNTNVLSPDNVNGNYYGVIANPNKNYTIFGVVNRQSNTAGQKLAIYTNNGIYFTSTAQPYQTHFVIGVMNNVNLSISGNVATNYTWDSFTTLSNNMVLDTDDKAYLIYHFNEGGGSTVDNAQGNATLDLTMSNATFSQSKKGYGYNSSNGVSLTCATGTSAKLAYNNISIFAWIKLKSYGVENEVIFSQGGDYYSGITFFIKKSASYYLYFNNGTNPPYGGAGGYYSAGTTWKLNEWYHVGFTYNFIDDNLTFYTNGVPVSSVKMGFNGTAIIPDSTNFVIGDKYTCNGWGLDGYIDEFYLMDKVLNQSEITALFGTGKPDFLDNRYISSYNNVSQLGSFAETFSNISLTTKSVSRVLSGVVGDVNDQLKVTDTVTFSLIPNDFGVTASYWSCYPSGSSAFSSRAVWLVPTLYGDIYCNLSSTSLSPYYYNATVTFSNSSWIHDKTKSLNWSYQAVNSSITLNNNVGIPLNNFNWSITPYGLSNVTSGLTSLAYNSSSSLVALAYNDWISEVITDWMYNSSYHNNFTSQQVIKFLNGTNNGLTWTSFFWGVTAPSGVVICDYCSATTTMSSGVFNYYAYHTGDWVNVTKINVHHTLTKITQDATVNLLCEANISSAYNFTDINSSLKGVNGFDNVTTIENITVTTTPTVFNISCKADTKLTESAWSYTPSGVGTISSVYNQTINVSDPLFSSRELRILVPKSRLGGWATKNGLSVKIDGSAIGLTSYDTDAINFIIDVPNTFSGSSSLDYGLHNLTMTWTYQEGTGGSGSSAVVYTPGVCNIELYPSKRISRTGLANSTEIIILKVKNTGETTGTFKISWDEILTPYLTVNQTETFLSPNGEFNFQINATIPELLIDGNLIITHDDCKTSVALSLSPGGNFFVQFGTMLLNIITGNFGDAFKTPFDIFGNQVPPWLVLFTFIAIIIVIILFIKI